MTKETLTASGLTPKATAETMQWYNLLTLADGIQPNLHRPTDFTLNNIELNLDMSDYVDDAGMLPGPTYVKHECGTTCCILGSVAVAFPESCEGIETWADMSEALFGIRHFRCAHDDDPLSIWAFLFAADLPDNAHEARGRLQFYLVGPATEEAIIDNIGVYNNLSYRGLSESDTLGKAVCESLVSLRVTLGLDPEHNVLIPAAMIKEVANG